MAYAELFCQSYFSFLQGASSPEELIQQAAELGYDALALTDECSVAGIVRAYRQINEQQLNIKLIVGSYFQLDNLQLVLLCPDKAAYAELCRIITNARRRSSKGDNGYVGFGPVKGPHHGGAVLLALQDIQVTQIGVDLLNGEAEVHLIALAGMQ